MKVFKYVLVGLGVVLGLFLGKAFLSGFGSSFAPDKMVDKAQQAEYAISTFNAVNQERKRIGISELIVDQNLCAYARKKSTELAISLDESPQINFANEIKDSANQTYFNDFKTLGLNYQGGGKLKRPDNNLAQMFLYQGTKAASNPDFIYGCVADSSGSNAGRVYTVFIGAQK